MEDGKIFMHVENDGWDCIRHGVQAREWEVSLGEMAACYPSDLQALIKNEKDRFEKRAKEAGLPLSVTTKSHEVSWR
jgi:hypothetical protein